MTGEVRPLREPEPEVEAVRESLRASRRAMAWKLLAGGLALAIAGALVLAWAGHAPEVPAAQDVEIRLSGIWTTAAALSLLIGLGLVGTAVFALVKTRRSQSVQQTRSGT